MTIYVDAADERRNADLDALFLVHCEADPRNDEPSNENVQRVVRDLWVAWCLAEGGMEAWYEEPQ
jgi:hypothetical protein